MTIRTGLLLLTLFVVSCKNNDAKIKSLNEQSLKCIRIMNETEVKKTAAINIGDAAATASAQKTIDSAAMENAKIGKELEELKEND